MGRKSAAGVMMAWALATAALAQPAAAPASVDGRWRVRDPDTGKVAAVIEIRTNNGRGVGRLDPYDTPADARCKACRDGLKNAPMHGLPLLQDLHVEEGIWQGRILDPDSGRTYALELRNEGGNLRITARALFGLVRHHETWPPDTAAAGSR